jgi:hypothetical protein
LLCHPNKKTNIAYIKDTNDVMTGN